MSADSEETFVFYNDEKESKEDVKEVTLPEKKTSDNKMSKRKVIRESDDDDDDDDQDDHDSSWDADEQEEKQKKRKTTSSDNETPKKEKYLYKAPNAFGVNVDDMNMEEDVDMSGKIWLMRFNQPQALKQLLDIVSNVLEQCHIDINASEAFRGMSISTMDTSKISMVIARMKTEVYPTLLEEAESICVNIKRFKAMVNHAVSPRERLDIYLRESDGRIVLDSHDPMNPSHRKVLTMTTIDEENESEYLDTMFYEYTVQIDINVLRNANKMANLLGATELILQIKKITRDDGMSASYFRLIGEGDGSDTVDQFYTPTQQTQSTNGSLVIQTMDTSTVPKESEEEIAKMWKNPDYNERFHIKYLLLFLGSMENKTVLTMKMSPNNPLVIMYPLGDEEQSYCQFILAPKKED